MRKLKKICLTTLLIVLLVSAMAITIHAGDYEGDMNYAVSEDYLYFVLTDGTVAITGYTNYGAVSVDIPNTIDGKTVTRIENEAFAWNENISTLTIPSTVTYIGDSVFTHCSSLSSVTIPSAVTYIGDYAFYGCDSLTSISQPNHYTGIYDDFVIVDGRIHEYRGDASSITIPSGVTAIGSSALAWNVNLTDLSIPDSVVLIGQSAFAGTPWKESIDALDDEFVIVGGGVLLAYHGDSATVVVPDGVVSLAGGAFEGCSMTSIELPNTLSNIGAYAFSGCGNLKSIVIPDTVTNVGEAAFYYCTSLSSVTLPSTITHIMSWAFAYCTDLTSVIIPDDVYLVDCLAFLCCSSLSSATIPDTVAYVGGGAFCDCSNLTDVYYSGSESQWSDIRSGADNGELFSATIHYSSATIPTEALTDAIQYVPYATQIPTGNSITSGSLPKGLGLFSDGTISGIPTQTGTLIFTVAGTQYSITVEAGTEATVDAVNDYTIIDAVPTISSNETDQIYHISGPYDDFLDFYINGVKMIKDVEYIAEEGSTKITVLGQTFAQQPSGSHTITATFQPATSSESVAQVSQVVEKTVEADTSLMPYTDVATSEWYYDYVYLMYRRDIIAGTSGTTYSPESNLTRAMMVDALYQLAGAPEATASSFDDVDYSLWYADAVNWASETGITNGTGDNQFSPNNSITREEMATMLQRYCDTFGVTLPLQTSAQPTDLASISDWATSSATTMYQRGVLNGDTIGNFNPTGTATRAEAASMFSNFLSILDRI